MSKDFVIMRCACGSEKNIERTPEFENEYVTWVLIDCVCHPCSVAYKESDEYKMREARRSKEFPSGTRFRPPVEDESA